MRTLIVLAVLVVAVCYVNPTEGNDQALTDAPGKGPKRKGEVNPPPEARRKKRGLCGKASKMSDNDMDKILKDHNKKRGETSSAADMIKMTWNKELADRAQEWAEECTWAHGMSNLCDDTIYLGQNMYLTTAAEADVEEVMNNWYNEKYDFDYEKNLCSSGAICGHYTQLVWSESHEVGCGIAHCPKVAVGDEFWDNSVILVCDYWPTGNWDGEQPYNEGDQCSQCKKSFEDGGIVSGFTCDAGLCKPCLPEYDTTCVCDDSYTSTCQANGGTWSAGICRCVCPAGFYGKYCDQSCTCEDSADYASACPTWAAGGLCTDATYAGFMASSCPKTCNMCPAVPDECQ